MGPVLSANFGRNLDMAVRQPIKRCTSFTFFGLRISIMALHFSGFASIPRVSMKPKKFPTISMEYTLFKVKSEVMLS